MIPEINVEQAKQQLNADPQCLYLDVRTVQEFEQGHVPGAYNVPILILSPVTGQAEPNPDFLRVVQANLPTDQKIICGCKSGGRSARATEELLKAGYADVVNMIGGFHGKTDLFGRLVDPGWTTKNYPATDDAQENQTYRALREKADRS